MQDKLISNKQAHFLKQNFSATITPIHKRYWAGPSSSYHLILVCANYDLNGSLRIDSRLHARLNNQISHPIPSWTEEVKLVLRVAG